MTVATAHPRCFAGVTVTETWDPARHCTVRAEEGAGLQWFEPSALHMTLCYIGWLSEDLCRRVQSALRRLPPLPPVHLTGTLTVVGTGRTRSLIAPIEPAGTLLGIRQAAAEAIGEVVGSVAFGEFRPHLTVARVAPDTRIVEGGSHVHAVLPVGRARLYAGRTTFFQP